MRTSRSPSGVMFDATALEHWMLGVVAALSCAPAGCSGSSSTSIEHNRGFVRPACSSGGVHQWFQGMTLPAGTDYIKLQEDGAAPLELGVACATAQDMATCSAAVASAPMPMVAGTPFGFCGDVCARANVIETRGDSVIVASNVDQIRQALLPIDDAAKAMLLASLSGLDVSCAEGGAAPTSGGWTVMGLTYEGCDGKTRHVLKVAIDGTVTGVSSEVLQMASSNCVVGRRPPDLRAALQPRAPTVLGAYFSEMATLEAASVHAFVRIEAELAGYGAPTGLVDAAARAARDEVRHARATARLARRFGARPARPRIDRAPLRALAEFAIDNEKEGCVRETFGALVGTHQAATAKDPRIARALRRIAADERRHVALAWDIARWSLQRLSSADRARVRESRKEAVASLLVDVEREPSPLLVSNAGIPSRSAARVLHAQARRVLWEA
jgi:hypothetical protein